MRDLVALAAVLLPLLLLDTGWGGSFGAPDLLPPGHRPVEHRLILDWPAERDWRFCASPTAGMHGTTAIARGEPFAFSSKYGTRIYALPRGAALPAAAEALAATAWPHGAVPVREVASTAVGSRLARVVTTLRVTAIDGNDIHLAVVREQRFDADGRELGNLDWLPLAVVAAAGAAWLFVLDRRVLRSVRGTAEAP